MFAFIHIHTHSFQHNVLLFDPPIIPSLRPKEKHKSMDTDFWFHTLTLTNMRTNDNNIFPHCVNVLSTDCASFFFLWKQHKATQIFTTFTLWKWLMCRAGYWSTAKAEDSRKNTEMRERERSFFSQLVMVYMYIFSPAEASSIWKLLHHQIPPKDYSNAHEHITNKIFNLSTNLCAQSFFSEVTIQIC